MRSKQMNLKTLIHYSNVRNTALLKPVTSQNIFSKFYLSIKAGEQSLLLNKSTLKLYTKGGSILGKQSIQEFVRKPSNIFWNITGSVPSCLRLVRGLSKHE